MRQSQRILAVVNDRALFDKVAHPLGRSSLEVNRVPSGAGALILVGNLKYDLILVEAPLPDLDLAQFIAAVRTIDSPCSASAVMVLAQTAEAADLSATLGEDVTVLAAKADVPELHSTISRALGVAVRARSRVVVQIEAALDEGPFQRVGQSANLSETGLLLTGTPSLPIGVPVKLTLELPDDPHPLRLAGEVVRHATPEVDDLSGIGVRFLDVSNESAERLRKFVLEQRAREQDSGGPALELDQPAGSAGHGA